MGEFWSAKFIALWVVIVVGTIVSVIVFSVFKTNVDAEVKDAGELCSTSWRNYDFFKNPPKQLMQNYVYNISNPAEYLAGGEAQLHEKGPYLFDLDINRREIDFYDDGKYVDFTVLNFLDFKEDKLCKGCKHVFEEKVTVMNPFYQVLLAGATSEATLFVGLSCTTQQIGLMKQNPTAPYCTKAQRGVAGQMCRCCVPPVDGFVSLGLNVTEYDDPTYSFCSEITNPVGAQAGLFGWLGKHDGAFKLSNTPGAFALSDGTYTNYLRTYSVSELLTGSMSALAGLITYSNSVRNLALPANKEAYYDILNATEDMKSVCYNPNYDFCPTLEEIQTTLNTFTAPNIFPKKVAYLKTVTCTGIVPDYKDLMATGGLSEERALELRYIEGLPCSNFAPAIAFSSLISNAPLASTKTCADGTTNFPCCMDSFTLNLPSGSASGRGMGCLRFIDGVVQRKRVYTAEDAREVLGNTVTHKTVCTDNNKLELHEWFGKTGFDEWFTPNSYVHGVTAMPWADPSIINNANSLPGTFTDVVIKDGRAVTQTVGNGAGKSFLATDLNDGTVEDEKFLIYATNIQRVREAKFVGNEDQFDLQVAKYQVVFELGADDASTAESERSGQMPFPNIVNLVYTERSKPAFLTQPNFLDVNPAIFTQSNNAKRMYANGVGGVGLFRTRAKYEYDAEPIEPERMNRANVEENRKKFESWWDFEPATGLTVTNQVTGMFGLFSMNCNPQLDSFCNFKATLGGDLCYPRVDDEGDAYTTPCSNANVLTPAVQGEKLLPLYWNSVKASPPASAIDRATALLDIRFAFSILCVIFPCSLFILCVFTIYHWKSTHEAGTVATVFTPADPATKKSGNAPADGEVAMVAVTRDETI